MKNKCVKELTNQDIPQNYREGDYWFTRSDFIGAFVCSITRQSPFNSYGHPDITPSLSAFYKYVEYDFPGDLPRRFTCDQLSNIINKDKLKAIPGIYDCIDLNALARSILHMLLGYPRRDE